MAIRMEERKLALTAEDIAATMEALRAFLAGLNVAGKEVTRLCLAVEEIIINWQVALGEDTVCTCLMKKRLGRISVVLLAPGPRVDPLRDFEAAEESVILRQLEIAPYYAYVGYTNRVTVPVTAPQRSGLWLLLGTIALAALGKALLGLMPADVQGFVTHAVASPLAEAYLRALTAAAAPFLLVTIVQSMLSMMDISVFARVGKRLIGTYVGLAFGAAVLSIGAGLLFYPYLGGTADGGSLFHTMRDIVLGIIPPDIFSPFINRSMLQVLFIAVITGLAGLALRDKLSGFAALVDQLQLLLRWVLGALAKLTPAYVFLSILSYDIDMIAAQAGDILLTVALIAGVCLVATGLLFAALCAITRVKPATALRRVIGPWMTGFATASSTATLPECIESCEKTWGVQERFTGFSMTLGMVTFKMAIVIAAVNMALYAAQVTGTPITASFLITLLLGSVVLVFTVVPVPGGALISYTALLSLLGMGIEQASAIVAINLLVDPLLASTTMSSLLMCVVCWAEKLGFRKEKGA